MKDPVNVFLIVLLLQMSYIDLTMLNEEQNKVLRYCSIAELLIEVDVHVPQHVCSGDMHMYRCHVALHLFRNRSRRSSKCGRNNKDTHKFKGECVRDFFYHILTLSVIY